MAVLPRREWGDPDSDRRTLLVHGLSSSGASWWRVAEALADDGWHVTAVDLRGHGDGPAADSYRVEDYASDLPAENWDLVIGHSLGGACAVLAAADPQFARRLVLLDPVLEIPDEQFDEVLADQLSEVELTEESLYELKPHWHERDRSAKLDAVRAIGATAVGRSITDNRPWNLVLAARSLRIPTLILGGDPSVYSMLATDTADALAATNPLVEYTVVAGAGHSPHRDRPEHTLALLRAWLAHHRE